MKACAICRQSPCQELIRFGEQPICHHFLGPDEIEATHPLTLGQCPACGLVQLLDPVPPAKLVPRFDWITYNEPEAHLDAVVERLLALPSINSEWNIGALSANDDSLLRRFRERGFARSWRLDRDQDLAITVPNAGIEFVQSRLRPPLAEAVRNKHGQPDLLIARMILEHASEPAVFLETIRKLIGPTGRVVFDVPDCSRAFDLCDYTTLWEDHTLYFVEGTFRRLLRQSGFVVEWLECFQGPYENCLVAVARSGPMPTQPGDGPEAASEFAQATKFANSFGERRAAVRADLEHWRQHGRIGLFGAGHQSVMFLALMGINDLVEFVVDDHPHKCGRRMPGSHLPIVGSVALYKEGVRLCLSSLGAASEPKVIGKHQQFVQAGGVFASIFPVRPGSTFRLLAGNATERDGHLLSE